eukprot:364733-Chlamydomonas_euryale.AAC.2
MPPALRTHLKQHGNERLDLQDLRRLLHDQVVVLEREVDKFAPLERRVCARHGHNACLLGHEVVDAVRLCMECGVCKGLWRGSVEGGQVQVIAPVHTCPRSSSNGRISSSSWNMVRRCRKHPRARSMSASNDLPENSGAGASEKKSLKGNAAAMAAASRDGAAVATKRSHRLSTCSSQKCAAVSHGGAVTAMPPAGDAPCVCGLGVGYMRMRNHVPVGRGNDGGYLVWCVVCGGEAGGGMDIIDSGKASASVTLTV